MAFTVQVTQEDIDNVAKKLDEFGAVLTDRERAVLHGALGMAGKSIDELASSASPEPASGSSTAQPSLSTAFRAAFQQGVGTKFTMVPTEAEGTTNIKVDYSKTDMM